MSLFAGIICHRGFNQYHKQLIRKVSSYFSDFNPQHCNKVSTDNCYISHFDFDAYKQPVFLQNETHCSTLIGHPLLSANRTDDIAALNGHLQLETSLAQCEGAFCYLNVDHEAKSLTLATDALGLRPFYYMVFDGALIISTQLTFFTRLGIHLTPNAAGLTEYATLGYFLLDHTPYKEVKCALPNQILRYTDHQVCLTQYFDWVTLANQQRNVPEAVAGISHAFKSACEKYRGHDQHVVTTLSGGLDSRLISSELKQQQCDISALNFSTQRTHDATCARAFAKHQNIACDFIHVNDTQSQTVEQRLGTYWRQAPHPDYANVTRPQLAWSGNGGSVGVGMVYYSESIYQAAKTGSLDKLIDAFLAQQYAYLPAKVVRQAKQYQDTLKQHLQLAFAPLTSLPLTKAYPLFLLLNDQRHHLSIPFENITDYQMEFCVPFFSWKVLQFPLSLPVEETRNHQFYMKWMELTYPEALETPWQAYPGHAACPHKVEGETQWQHNRRKVASNQTVARVWLRALRFDDHRYIRKPIFSLLCLLHLLKLRDATSTITLTHRLIRWRTKTRRQRTYSQTF
ncbi:hypothetical protein [Thaumasiovibrio sp. DFM-14]|uniref:hypothetical protein n=1 Tax=Thaumasiovibrio sp. DFM-14 TaxID=3384792 RepID=UPI0039A21EBE